MSEQTVICYEADTIERYEYRLAKMQIIKTIFIAIVKIMTYPAQWACSPFER